MSQKLIEIKKIGLVKIRRCMGEIMGSWNSMHRLAAPNLLPSAILE